MTYQIKSNWHWLKRIILFAISFYVASLVYQYDFPLAVVAFIWTYAISWLLTNGLIYFIDEKLKSSKHFIGRQKSTK